MGDDGETCFTGLGLGIGIGVGEYMPCKSHHSQQKKAVSLDLSFPHHPKEEAIDTDYKNEDNSSNGNDNDNDDNHGENNNKCRRKKLRLTKEQYTLLEDSFSLHHTLNSNQKQTLAGKLNLQPRQVEVWFQNRRARTKLKQTEVDCEYLKKCCASLSEENRRLKKELRELVALKFCPFYIQFPKAVVASELNICPSCDEATATATDIVTATATDTATTTTREKCEE